MQTQTARDRYESVHNTFHICRFTFIFKHTGVEIHPTGQHGTETLQMRQIERSRDDSLQVISQSVYEMLKRFNCGH